MSVLASNVQFYALSEIIASLSHALDMTEGQPPGHSLRTCAIGMRLGEELGLPAEQRSALYYALLLRGAGCSGLQAGRTSNRMLPAAVRHRCKIVMKLLLLTA